VEERLELLTDEEKFGKSGQEGEDHLMMVGKPKGSAVSFFWV